ncbi:MAG: hypothetical protein QGG64_07460, partial [Candidatus Latescibacteria bacterium]|nr:hypothetical protein [Candidatus Latescibacterota bacterium]
QPQQQKSKKSFSHLSLHQLRLNLFIPLCAKRSKEPFIMVFSYFSQPNPSSPFFEGGVQGDWGFNE